jgi:hypothetical protein
MKLLFTTLTPLSVAQSHAPRPARAISDFLAAGHEVYLAAPLVGRPDEIREAWKVQGVLPLLPCSPHSRARLAVNAYRLAAWGKQWRADVYLSLGGRAAMVAHTGRGAANGYGLSVLVLPALRWQAQGGPNGWLERRAIPESDRLLTYDPEVVETVITRYGARRADTILLPGEETAPFATLCEQFLIEPPGYP